MASPAFPGMFFAFAAAVLLLFASVSPPVWERVSFLNVKTSAGETVYGVFGLCLRGVQCSTRNIGYNLQAGGVPTETTEMNTQLMHNLSKVLILHPIGGFIALLAFIFGLIGVAAASRAATIFMAILAFLAAVVTLVVFVIDMVLWNVLKNRLRDHSIESSLGNANWFTVGAAAALLLSMCTSFCGACGRFATGRSAGEKEGDCQCCGDDQCRCLTYARPSACQ